MRPLRLQRSNESREYCRSCCCLPPWQVMWVPSYVSACIISLGSYNHNRSGCGCGCGALIGAHHGGKYRGYSERCLLLCADFRNAKVTGVGACFLGIYIPQPGVVVFFPHSIFESPLAVQATSTIKHFRSRIRYPKIITKVCTIDLAFFSLIYYSVCLFLIFHIFRCGVPLSCVGICILDGKVY